MENLIIILLFVFFIYGLIIGSILGQKSHVKPKSKPEHEQEKLGCHVNFVESWGPVRYSCNNCNEFFSFTEYMGNNKRCPYCGKK